MGPPVRRQHHEVTDGAPPPDPPTRWPERPFSSAAREPKPAVRATRRTYTSEGVSGRDGVTAAATLELAGQDAEFGCAERHQLGKCSERVDRLDSSATLATIFVESDLAVARRPLPRISTTSNGGSCQATPGRFAGPLLTPDCADRGPPGTSAACKHGQSSAASEATQVHTRRLSNHPRPQDNHDFKPVRYRDHCRRGAPSTRTSRGVSDTASEYPAAARPGSPDCLRASACSDGAGWNAQGDWRSRRIGMSRSRIRGSAGQASKRTSRGTRRAA